MDLRLEPMPPRLDEAEVTRPAGLAANPNGTWSERPEEDLAEFDRLAGTA